MEGAFSALLGSESSSMGMKTTSSATMAMAPTSRRRPRRRTSIASVAALLAMES